jgi:AAA+ superfamily predicted ATPase
MSHFILSSKKKLAEMNVGDKLDESDFATLTPEGLFVQMKYVEDDEQKLEPTIVKPGVWTIVKTMTGLVLTKTEFVQDHILESFVSTEQISKKISHFFNKLHLYKEFGIEVPKRGMLLYGAPGGGKTTLITKIAKEYSQDNKTATVIWDTSKYEAHTVKDFIKSFEYQGVEKIILVVEDIGGVEIDQVRMRSDSSLLSLLDNQEKTFKIATLILATTNFPEVFLGNLTNRPQRFDDKIEVPHPPASARVELLKFFSTRETPSAEVLELIGSKAGEKFTPAHLREVVMRSALYDMTQVDVVREMISEIQNYEKAFSKTQKMGF